MAEPLRVPPYGLSAALAWTYGYEPKLGTKAGQGQVAAIMKHAVGFDDRKLREVVAEAQKIAEQKSQPKR